MSKKTYQKIARFRDINHKESTWFKITHIAQTLNTSPTKAVQVALHDVYKVNSESKRIQPYTPKAHVTSASLHSIIINFTDEQLRTLENKMDEFYVDRKMPFCHLVMNAVNEFSGRMEKSGQHAQKAMEKWIS